MTKLAATNAGSETELLRPLDYALFFLFAGVVVLGLVLAPVAVTVSNNEQLQQPQSSQHDLNSPSSSTACLATTNIYFSGAISSALALIIFSIHLCIKKL